MREHPAGLRVHFVVHHQRDRAAGASGATLALGNALEALGCCPSYYFLDDAFGAAPFSEVQRMLRFPWRVARHLAAAASRVDVVDATSGDAWLWCGQRRPGGGSTALVTRAHGLEHVTAHDLRRRARAGHVHLSWKYPIYHGGYRLWEVRRSMVGADGQIFLNAADRDYAVSAFGITAGTSVVLPNGVPDRLLDLPPVTSHTDASSPIALAFVGSWIPRKGTRAVVEMASALHERGISFTLRLLGTGMDAVTVRENFIPDVRAHIEVVPHFAPEELAGLLSDAEVMVHPSWTEGFSLALVEGMACGLAPVSTRSGGAADVVRDGESGIMLPDDRGASLADAVVRLSADRALLGRMRGAAQADARRLRWASIAERTLAFYRSAIARRARAAGRT